MAALGISMRALPATLRYLLQERQHGIHGIILQAGKVRVQECRELIG